MFFPSIIQRRGFTLIELLVVFAIIAILVSIVLASLSIARGMGTDAKVKRQLSNMRNAAMIFYDDQSPKSFGNTTNQCDDAMFIDMRSGFIHYTNPVNMPPGATLSCVSNGEAYAVAAELENDTEWCVDSAGYGGIIDISNPAAITISDTTCQLMDAK